MNLMILINWVLVYNHKQFVQNNIKYNLLL
jgi:hypothetical protein